MGINMKYRKHMVVGDDEAAGVLLFGDEFSVNMARNF